MIGQSRAFLRYLTGLSGYVRNPISLADAPGIIDAQNERRTRSFLRILHHGIYGNPGSPYLRLLQHAGVAYGDVSRMIDDSGLDATMERLHDVGVHVKMDEFKGRRPIVRPGLEIQVAAQDFDNPLLSRYYRASTGGSRTAGLSVAIDIDLLRHEAAYMAVYMRAFDLFERPQALWLGAPPVAAGMKNVLRYAGLGKSVDRWFAQTRRTWPRGGWRYALYEAITRYTVRLNGRPFPAPRFTPRARAIDVARQLASWRSAGTPGVLDTNATSAVRVCLAAGGAGLDIEGSHFRLGGEPLTDAKIGVIRAAGCAAVTHYAMAELGAIGMGCADPASHDDVHLLTDKLAMIQRDREVADDGRTVPAMIFTTLLEGSPKIMLNVESDDYAVVERRDCSCDFGRLGYDRHLRRIRSYEKLTSEGVTFLGSELHRLLEEVLPSAFGGSPTDYQLAEEERDGLTVLSLLVSPSIRDVDLASVRETVFRTLEEIPGGDVMADQWRQGDIFRVVRAEPHVTSSAKILPLHLVRHNERDATRAE